MLLTHWHWTVICPRCQQTSVRRATTIPRETRPMCQHAYHAAEDCDVCGDCRNERRQDA